MSWYEKFKNFIGLSSLQDNSEYNNPQNRWPEPPPNPNEYRRPFDGPPTFPQDPFEMQQFLEEQINNMLSSFGLGDFGNSSIQIGFPQIGFDEPQQDESSPGSLRDQFLKPTQERGSPRAPLITNQITDDRLDIGNWDSVFKGVSTPQTHFYGQSVTSKTVVNSDGSVETHRTVRDNEGNEETTITKRIGDKEHSVTKRKNKEGKEETIENLVNLDEKELNKYFPTQQKEPKNEGGRWPFYDRFFK